MEQWLHEVTEWVSGFGTGGIFIFALIYALAAVCFVPGSVLTIGAGAIFGLGWGFVAVSMGSLLAAAAAFLIARYVLRKKVQSLAWKHKKFSAIDKAIGKEGWKIVLLLRLSPLIPFSVSNYLYGITAIPFRPYLAASWVGMLPATLLYVYLGVVGREGIQAVRQGSVNQLRTWLLVGGLVATAAVTVLISRLAKKALRESHLEEKK